MRFGAQALASRGAGARARRPGAGASGGTIVTLELAPGSFWSELQLSEMIGIGRTPVREALQRLQTDHLVRILPRLGAQVTEINVSQQLLLLELRRVLERLIAGERGAPCHARGARSSCCAWPTRWKRMVDSDVLKFLRYHYDIKRYIADVRPQSVRRPARSRRARDVAALLLPSLPPGARPAGRGAPPRRRDPRRSRSARRRAPVAARTR